MLHRSKPKPEAKAPKGQIGPAVVKVAEPDPHDDLLPEETERREIRHAVFYRSKLSC